MGRKRVMLVSRPPLSGWMVIVVVLLGALSLAGCPDNQAACSGYYQALSQARTQCGIEPNDPDDPLADEAVVCPASLNHGGNCVDHYLTLRDSVYCDATNNTVAFQQLDGGPRPGETRGCF